MSQTTLNRSISLPMLILYGLGTMIGGGFYPLLGEIAGEAALFTPLAFLLAGLLAFISATFFAELSSRFSFSAGKASYTQETFSNKNFSTLVGWLVILSCFCWSYKCHRNREALIYIVFVVGVSATIWFYNIYNCSSTEESFLNF